MSEKDDYWFDLGYESGKSSRDAEIAELRQQLADVRNQVLEECAAIAEDTAAGRDAEAIADAIRARKLD